jgi:hypothetical protein
MRTWQTFVYERDLSEKRRSAAAILNQKKSASRFREADSVVR